MEKQNAIEPTTPAPTGQHAEAAQALMARIDAIRAELPILTTVKLNKQALASGKAVPADFMEETNVALQGQDVPAWGGAEPAQLRNLVSYSVAYGPVATAMERAAKEMRRSVDTARAQAGSEALTTYSIAQRLSDIPGNEHLVPVVEKMRRMLRTAPRFKKRASKKKADGTPVTTTAPAPIPTTTTAPTTTTTPVETKKP